MNTCKQQLRFKQSIRIYAYKLTVKDLSYLLISSQWWRSVLERLPCMPKIGCSNSSRDKPKSL